jgi:hypothetical protein
MKFPSEMRLIEQPAITLFREDSGGFAVYFEGSDPATGETVTLRLAGTTADPQGGVLGTARVAAIEAERAKVEKEFSAKS